MVLPWRNTVWGVSSVASLVRGAGDAALPELVKSTKDNTLLIVEFFVAPHDSLRAASIVNRLLWREMLQTRGIWRHSWWEPNRFHCTFGLMPVPRFLELLYPPAILQAQSENKEPKRTSDGKKRKGVTDMTPGF